MASITPTLPVLSQDSELTDKRQPWNTKERKYVLPSGTRFDIRLIPIIQNLVAAGMTEADIGAIVGYQGENAENWLAKLKQIHPEVKEACQIGKRIADSFLVAQMYKTAIGYEFLEQKYKRDRETGEMILAEETVNHQPGNAQLAMFIATNHMPEQYKHRLETTKKGYLINATTEITADQIEKLAGKLMDEANRVKQIESTVIETIFEPITARVEEMSEETVDDFITNRLPILSQSNSSSDIGRTVAE
jgi:hypothetical protein